VMNARASFVAFMFLMASRLAEAQPIIPNTKCIAPQRLQSLVLTLSATALNVPGDPKGGGLHWVVDPLPTGDDISISDPNLKNAIERWVSDFNNSPTKHAWVLDGKNPWRFLSYAGLNGGVGAAFDVSPIPVVSSPTMSQAGTRLRQSVSLCAAPVQNLFLDMLNIRIISADYDPDYPQAPQVLSAKLDEGITASALLSAADSQIGQPVLEAFSRVAETAWQTAKRNGISLRSRATGATLSNAENAVTRLYNMVQDNIASEFWSHWPEAHAKFEATADNKCCTLTIRNVRMAKGASIHVEANLPDADAKTPQALISHTPGGVTPAALKAPKKNASATTKKVKRAEALAARSQRDLSRRFAPALAAFSNAVPTFAQVDALRSQLDATRELNPTVRPMLSDADARTIVFDGDYRWTILDVTLSAGGGYSPEDKGTGKLDFQGQNLMFQIPAGLNPTETESASYAGGGEVQKANVHWGLNWVHTCKNGAQSNYGPQVSWDYSQDQNQRFGNVSGPVLRDHEIGWEPSAAISVMSSPLGRDGTPAKHSLGLNIDGGFRQRWFRVTPATGSGFPLRGSGTLNAFFLDLTPAYHYQPSKAFYIGGVDVVSVAHFLKGFNKFTFTQFQVSVQVAAFFGNSHPRDFFVRFRKGMGTSNGATPLVELFRLGGADNTRGIEQGEQVGRQIAFEQSEAGVSVHQIVSWFQKPPNPAQAEKTPQASPLDLSKFYVKSFYDRGRVFNNASFADMLNFSHGAKGYGLAVEMEALSTGNKRISVSVGWARSPDSFLHRSGVALTSATVDF
jgi:hypothetical protein